MNLSQIDLGKIFSFAENLLKGKNLLTSLKNTTNKNWTIIHDIPLAIECATSQAPSPPSTQSWGDLRQLEAGRIPWISGLYQKWEAGVGEGIYKYLSALAIDEDIHADIEGDLYNICAMDYLAPDDIFWGQLKEAYSEGGWPCGWGGAIYPNGHLIVLDRKI